MKLKTSWRTSALGKAKKEGFRGQHSGVREGVLLKEPFSDFWALFSSSASDRQSLRRNALPAKAAPLVLFFVQLEKRRSLP